jgi:rRNA processing protein Krr1/Pno1
MTQAKKIIQTAMLNASNEQARSQLETLEQSFQIIADMRFAMYAAYINAGFDPDQAMFLLSLDIEFQQAGQPD